MGDYDHYEGLIVERIEEGILRISMRAEKTGQQHGDLGRIFVELDRGPEVRAVLVGPDLRHDVEHTIGKYGEATIRLMRDVADNYETRMRVYQEASDLVYNLINCSKPVVALYPGAFAPVTLHADVSIATRDAVFFDAHVGYGVVAGDHAVMSWPLHIGMAKAKYYLLTGEKLSGEEAERLGLVSLVVDEDQLEEKGREIATKLARGSQRAVRWTKYSLNNFYRMAGPSFDASLAMEFINFGGVDVQEGINAMAEKREANYPERIQ
jgi:enoyl-CoA hydratase/carnithine racemase